jgi:hypothetical protein
MKNRKCVKSFDRNKTVSLPIKLFEPLKNQEKKNEKQNGIA